MTRRAAAGVGAVETEAPWPAAPAENACVRSVATGWPMSLAGPVGSRFVRSVDFR